MGGCSDLPVCLSCLSVCLSVCLAGSEQGSDGKFLLEQGPYRLGSLARTKHLLRLVHAVCHGIDSCQKKLVALAATVLQPNTSSFKAHAGCQHQHLLRLFPVTPK